MRPSTPNWAFGGPCPKNSGMVRLPYPSADWETHHCLLCLVPVYLAGTMLSKEVVPNGDGCMTHSLMELGLYTVKFGRATTPGLRAQKCMLSK